MCIAPTRRIMILRPPGHPAAVLTFDVIDATVFLHAVDRRTGRPAQTFGLDAP